MIGWLLAIALAGPVGRPVPLPYGDGPIPEAPVPQPVLSLESPAVAGAETVVAVVDATGDPGVGRTVQVFYRPGLDGETQTAIGITDSRGRVRWTPLMSGIARLQAGNDTLPVRVHGDTPAGTATLLALLVGVALGAIGFSQLRRRRPA